MSFSIELPPSLWSIVKQFSQKGYAIYLVGGAVRDRLLGKEALDFDLATNATPKEIIRLFKRVIPTGIKHGTVTILSSKESYEVTTFRSDSDSDNKRHPNSVNYLNSFEADVLRRDFTINGIGYDPIKRQVIDFVGGREDIEKRVIRTIGEPEKRFKEDSLRIMRGARFAAQLNFKIDQSTEEGMARCASYTTTLSSERVRDELLKGVASEKPSIMFKALAAAGVLALLLPELERLRSVRLPNTELSLWDHLTAVCDSIPPNKESVRVAALLCKSGDRERGEEVTIADKLLRRLKFPNKTREEVVHLVKHLPFSYTPDWSDSAVRAFAAKVGKKALSDLLLLKKSDLGVGRQREKELHDLSDLEERIKKLIIDDAPPLSIKELKINGKILIENGIPPGPHLGDILDHLLSIVIENPLENRRERLLEIALQYNRH